ncbi:MAG: hypothetical protein ABIP74_01700, partial [Candidatus Saccharimonas sp.]
DGLQAIAISKPYLWENTALPADELRDFRNKTLDAMHDGGWNITKTKDGSVSASRGDLKANMRYMAREEAEYLLKHSIRDDYKVLDWELYGPDMHLTDDERVRPWHILEGGIRKPLERGSPSLTDDPDDLKKYIPFQLELGCGPSIEAGVPPLAHLHKTYAISNPKTHHFLIGEEDDLPVRLFGDTENFYRDASLLYATAMKSEPNTLFYQSVKDLFHEGKILDPVFTNNYDGLISDIGMTEYYMRRFEDAHVFPDVTFNPDAKALVVVGSHADRRKLQEQARASGLQVIYVDPESYLDEETGTNYPYPIEAPQDDDMIYRMTAERFGREILRKL